jgi:two-component system, OmpR family, sensor histidine kinase KdpD
MPRLDDRRPDPGELLRRVQAGERRESRGRLKVFLGYAPRVGKSLRMFDEGRRRKARGQDVIVGAVQAPVSPEIQAVIDRLEAVPQSDEGAIDLVTLFRRHPQVCLIDGLAQSNPPGSRNPQRWQDVRDLLDQGISVMTALNVQHIREQQNDVERITGKRAAHSIPQDFLHEADEIEVVDAPPEALLEGKTAEGAAPTNTFNARQLLALRELALLLAADIIDRQLQEYLDEHGVEARWGAQERILVCLTPRSSALEMLHSGHRNATRFHGALLAAYVEQIELNGADREQLERNMALARQLGAEVHCLHGQDFVTAILDFAREQRITQLFIGHSMRDGHKALWRGPVDRLIDAADEFDVRIFPHREAQ